jgi:hypothetical protein
MELSWENVSASSHKNVYHSSFLFIALKQVKDQLDHNIAYVVQGSTHNETSDHISIESLLKPASTEYFDSEEELTINGMATRRDL